MLGIASSGRQIALSCLRKSDALQPHLHLSLIVGGFVQSRSGLFPTTERRSFVTTTIYHKKKKPPPRTTGDVFRDFAFAGEDIDPDDYFVQEELELERAIREAEAVEEEEEAALDEVQDETGTRQEKMKPEGPANGPQQREPMEATIESEVTGFTIKGTETVKATAGAHLQPSLKTTAGTTLPSGKLSTRDTRKHEEKSQEPVTARHPKRRGRPPSSPGRKAIAEEKKKLQMIRELRVLALKPPKKLPETAQRLVLRDLQTNDFQAAIVAQAELTPEEQQAMEKRAAQNRETNARNLREWLSTLSPLQVKQANSARRKLKRLLGKPRIWLIRDERIVKRPLDAWKVFLKEKNETRSPDESILQMTHRISREWRSLTPEQREVFERKAYEDFERYVRDYREVYGEEPPKGTGKARRHSVKQESKTDDPKTAEKGSK